jgi:hypothetical protein
VMIPTAKAAAHRDDALTFFSMVTALSPEDCLQKTKDIIPPAGTFAILFSCFCRAGRCAKRLPPRPYFSLRDAPGTSDAGPVYRVQAETDVAGVCALAQNSYVIAHNDGAFWPVCPRRKNRTAASVRGSSPLLHRQLRPATFRSQAASF